MLCVYSKNRLYETVSLITQNKCLENNHKFTYGYHCVQCQTVGSVLCKFICEFLIMHLFGYVISRHYDRSMSVWNGLKSPCGVDVCGFCTGGLGITGELWCEDE